MFFDFLIMFFDVFVSSIDKSDGRVDNNQHVLVLVLLYTRAISKIIFRIVMFVCNCLFCSAQTCFVVMCRFADLCNV